MLAQRAVMRLHVVRPSVRLSVTFRYRVQIGLNSSKIISQPNIKISKFLPHDASAESGYEIKQTNKDR